jgi:hypothetical protein
MKFFEENGDIFIEVTPVKSLFHSGMVHDVVTSGRKFVVNMNTGELTIRGKEFPVQEKKPDPRPRYKADGEETVVISDDFRVARVQLMDQVHIHQKGGAFWYGPSQNRKKIRYNGFWPAFIEEVAKLYP